MLQCVAVCCSVLQCVVMRCNVLQRAVCCSVLQNYDHHRPDTHVSSLCVCKSFDAYIFWSKKKKGVVGAHESIQCIRFEKGVGRALVLKRIRQCVLWGGYD